MSQKKKSNISFGPGASSLILIFVVLAMAVLGMLTLMNSRNDVRLSERSAQVTEAVYALNAQAEEKRAALDALAKRCGGDLTALDEALPEGVTREESLLSWEETDGVRRLDCALALLPEGAAERTQWKRYTLTARAEGEADGTDTEGAIFDD